MKAFVAVEHAMFVAWNMLTNGEFDRDPAPTTTLGASPAKTKARAVS